MIPGAYAYIETYMAMQESAPNTVSRDLVQTISSTEVKVRRLPATWLKVSIHPVTVG